VSNTDTRIRIRTITITTTKRLTSANLMARSRPPVLTMIDIHHHCLPGVDDGPRNADESADLCRMSADEGIETIVATPHVLRGRWKNTSRAQLEAILADLQSRIGDAPRLLLGSEYFFAHD